MSQFEFLSRGQTSGWLMAGRITAVLLLVFGLAFGLFVGNAVWMAVYDQ